MPDAKWGGERREVRGRGEGSWSRDSMKLAPRILSGSTQLNCVFLRKTSVQYDFLKFKFVVNQYMLSTLLDLTLTRVSFLPPSNV